MNSIFLRDLLGVLNTGCGGFREVAVNDFSESDSTFVPRVCKVSGSDDDKVLINFYKNQLNTVVVGVFPYDSDDGLSGIGIIVK